MTPSGQPTAPTVAVMGAGSWGTAFSLVVADAGCSVRLWARRPEVAATIQATRRNPDYLADITLPQAVQATADAQLALGGAAGDAPVDAVVLALPAQLVRAHLAQWSIPPDALVLSLAKGLEQSTGLTMSQVIAAEGIDPSQIGVLSGPNLAREIAERQPAASVVAADNEPAALLLQRICHGPNFRVYTISDVIGCELAGTAKNVIALAVGIALGLDVGVNARASIITRGLAETARLGVALGADSHTFAGLAGLGDLVATCSSPLSRNRTFGEMLGRGFSVAQATERSNGVAEGVSSCTSLQALARSVSVEVPIIDGVAAVVSGKARAEELAAALMNRSPKPERS